MLIFFVLLLRLLPMSVRFRFYLWIARRTGHVRLELAALEILKAIRRGAADGEIAGIIDRHIETKERWGG